MSCIGRLAHPDGATSHPVARPRGPARLAAATVSLAVLTVAGAAVAIPYAKPIAAISAKPLRQLVQKRAQKKAAITVSQTILAEPAAETALAITVGPADALPKNSFIQLRGLPATTALTDGHVIAPGAWAVPINALSELKIVVPTGVSGRSQLSIDLITIDGEIIAEATASLIIASAPPVPAQRRGGEPVARAATITPAEPPPPVAPPRAIRPAIPAAPGLAPDVKARADSYVAHGDSQMSEGNLAAARLFYQKAADLGLAHAALMMGATFDPGEFERLRVRGMAPDIASARQWYERARDLGSEEADKRLRRLAGR